MGKTLGRLLTIGGAILFPPLAPLGIAAGASLLSDALGLGQAGPKPSTAETALKRPRASSMLTIAEDDE